MIIPSNLLAWTPSNECIIIITKENCTEQSYYTNNPLTEFKYIHETRSKAKNTNIQLSISLFLRLSFHVNIKTVYNLIPFNRLVISSVPSVHANRTNHLTFRNVLSINVISSVPSVHANRTNHLTFCNVLSINVLSLKQTASL